MAHVKIFWDPEGKEVDSIGTKEFVRITDGDTPFVTMSVRMLSIDAPEAHYPGNAKPSKQDKNLAQLAKWIKTGKAPVWKGLGEYLYPKLATGKAGTLQEKQGEEAAKAYQGILDETLTLKSGKRRNLFMYAANEHFDQYGRLLAYMAPSYTEKERMAMSRRDRATFNLLMVESGWAASFPIYPSIPRIVDLEMLQESAYNAIKGKKGIWSDPNTLAGYEFRMCVRLYETTRKWIENKKAVPRRAEDWISRYCADMTTREIYFPQDYYKVRPENRVFVWPGDVQEAVSKMNLVPAGG
jgi:endonuclease YncB( thermonuclease family)